MFQKNGRYRIHSARMKGMASQNSFYSQPHPFTDTITVNRLIGILGTGGVKPARWSQVWRYTIMIHFQQYEKEFFYDQNG